jgi:ureidoglycolate hydrolase
MGEVLRQLTPSPVDEASWAPFGWIPLADTDPRDAQGTAVLEYVWGDAHVNRIGHRRDEVPELDAGLRCEMLFRHRTHTQVLMPLDVEAVLVVAPPGVELADADEVAEARAFVLRPLESIVLHRGTWHWGPFPVAAPSVELFNVQGRRYLEDNERADLVRIGVAIDVLLD